MANRTEPEVDRLWEEFHQAVNMTSLELRDFLLAESARGDAVFPASPDLGLPDLGRHVVRLLSKRKTDVTGEDVEAMRRVVDFVRDQLANRPVDAELDAGWRRALMTVGHDPLKPPRSADEESDVGV